jgi:hypothetical protein
VNVERAARELSRLRYELPELLGPTWPELEDEATALLDRLDAARDDAERRAAIEALVRRLLPLKTVRSRLQRALVAAADSTRGNVAPVPRDPPVLERWPHMDVDAPHPIPLAATFAIEVYADRRPDEHARPLVLPYADELTLDVKLVASDHFQVIGSDRGRISIRRDTDRSTTARFTLFARQAGASTPGVTALFFYEGRPAGSLHRELDVAGAQARTREESPPEPALRVVAHARAPDLTVQVEHWPGGGDARFACTVFAPGLEAYASGTTVVWDLRATSERTVAGYMARFTRAGASNAARRAALVGAGLALFGDAPRNFQDAYWALCDAGRPPRSILVVSSEPYVPWELMIPNRPGFEERLPLGVIASVGRWVHRQQLSPEQSVPLRDGYVIAPVYRDARELKFSAEEVRLVCTAFAGRRIEPATYEQIEAEFASGDASLLHLVCHGGDGGPGGQTIDLDPDETLSDFELRGMDGLKQAVAARRPLVFINACQVGRLTPALVGTGGFASAFITLGARCVIAPIWSVRDAVAAAVARAFYGEVQRRPDRPFADVLRDIRRRAYDDSEPEDSWAAYCFYGDPYASHAPT